MKSIGNACWRRAINSTWYVMVVDPIGRSQSDPGKAFALFEFKILALLGISLIRITVPTL